MKVILASAPEYKTRILELAGFEYELRPTIVDETLITGKKLPPAEAAMSLAAQKALAAWNNNDSEIVLGTGTIIAHDNEILGTPRDREEAGRMLRELSGSQHEVYTGVHLYGEYFELSFSDRTIVTMYDLSDEEIERHLDFGEYNRPGGYDIGGHGMLIIDRINGDYANLLGLPIGLLIRQLRACGFRI